jgi:hypothetical protein
MAKFKVGQIVEFTSASTALHTSVHCYKILCVLPTTGGGEQRYRVKTITEACERVACERELLFPIAPLRQPLTLAQ